MEYDHYKEVREETAYSVRHNFIFYLNKKVIKLKLKSNNGNNSEQELEKEGIKNRVIRGHLKF